MRRMLSIGLCAAIAGGAFVLGYKVHKWRYPLPLDHYVERKEAILQKVRQNRFYDYVVIGDSITEFTYLPSLCGKPALNAGIGGAVIGDATRLMADLSSILRAHTIVLAIGINDADTRRRRSDNVAADFERLVRLAKETGAEVFAATLAPVDLSKPDGAAHDPELITTINVQIRASIEQNHLINLDTALKPGDTSDGVHLTVAGTQHWRSAIEAAVCPSWHSADPTPLAARTLR
jgi:hypothetical protein